MSEMVEDMVDNVNIIESEDEQVEKEVQSIVDELTLGRLNNIICYAIDIKTKITSIPSVVIKDSSQQINSEKSTSVKNINKNNENLEFTFKSIK